MIEDNYIEKFLSNGWYLSRKFWDTLDSYQKEFVDVELGRSKEYYKKRLEAIGFKGKAKVLDAACGIGQWSIALAELNDEVIGIDKSEIRIKIALELLKSYPSLRCSFLVGSIENIPLEDSSIDAIFCYGSFMFTKMEHTMKEFKRILKSDGLLYLNFNTIGWYIYFIFKKLKEKKIKILIPTFYMIGRTLLRKKSNVIVSRGYIMKLLEKNNFEILSMGPEGSINLYKKEEKIEPLYISKFWGLSTIVEILARVKK